jgi:RNA polymerase sigma-70 factor, ECF subfamily
VARGPTLEHATAGLPVLRSRASFDVAMTARLCGAGHRFGNPGACGVVASDWAEEVGLSKEILAFPPPRADVGQGLSEVCHASYRRLVVQLYGVVGDISEAEDLVQEAFVRAAAAGNRFLRTDNHEAWLRTTALNVHSRRRRKLRKFAKIRDRHEQPTDLSGPDQFVAIVSAVRSLPEPTRQMIALHYLADLPVAEVASILGCPVGTVKSQLQLGRESLAVTLGSWWAHSESESLLREFRERAEHLVPMPDLDELQWQGTRMRRVQIAVGPALVASALAIGGVVVTSSIGDDAIPPASGGTADTSAPKGAMELPPDGATASTPASGELVVSMWSRGRTGWDGWVYVYADGRVIWQRRGPLPATGWLEQRLTPEGVELVQAEILSTGLFDPAQSPFATDPDRPPPGSELGYGWPSYGDIQVRNGGRLILVPGRPGQAWMPEFDRLQQRVAELQSWLPSSAWEDREIRAYVPSRYAICPYRFTAPLGWSRILPLLPPSAQELFADARPWRWDDRTGGSTCFDVTTEEAHTVAAALDDARIRRSLHAPLAYQFDAPDPIAGTIGIDFWPFLPDGVPATTAE